MVSRFTACSEVPFEYLCRFMDKCSRSPSKKKEDVFRVFLDKCVPRPTPDIFQIFRLLLPAEDLDRRTYGVKEERLAKLLVDAAGLSHDSPDAKHALKWKQTGVRFAGNFSEVVEQYVLKKACLADTAPAAMKVSVAEINLLLDRLALSDNQHQQVSVMRQLLTRCTASQMKWIVRIMLKDIKIGMTKERMLRIMHRDALDLLNMTNDLNRVCVELADPATHMPRRDLEPGCCVKAQLCARASSVEDAHTKMKGTPFTVEVKFDGNRLQIHKIPESMWYFSRRGREHGSLSDYDVFDEVVRQQVEPANVILDGEMVVWNKIKGVFEVFGGLRSAMIAAREGKGPDEIIRITDRGTADFTADPYYVHPTVADIELVYIAFDILFHEDESLITLPLQERQQRLAKVIKCLPADKPGIPCGAGTIHGRIVLLLPDQPVPLPMVGITPANEVAPIAGQGAGCAAIPELVFSRVGQTLEDLQNMYDLALSRQEEGIVVKQLNSVWKPDDRSGVWLKMKPDYFEMAEIDAVIIGGYFGGGRHGGLVSEFLLGLSEGGGAGPGGRAQAMKWCSFCRVGTGMSDVERQQLRERLQTSLIRSGPGVKPPRCYRISGKEKPDFWVADPLRSVVVEVKSDIRTIASKVYAANYSLRFPRITKICWDRSALDVTSCAQLQREVLDSKGRLTEVRKGMELGVPLPGARRKGGKYGSKPGSKGSGSNRRVGRPQVLGVLPNLSAVVQDTLLLAGKEVHFRNVCKADESISRKDTLMHDLATLVVKHGGKVVAVAGSQTDYVFAEVFTEHDSKALRIQEQQNQWLVNDVIKLEWLLELDDAAQGLSQAEREVLKAEALHPIMPRHRLYLTGRTRFRIVGSKQEQDGDHDRYGNPYLLEVTAEDVAALLGSDKPYRRSLILDRDLEVVENQLAAGEQQLQEQLERANTLDVIATQGTQDDKAVFSAMTGSSTPCTAQSLMLEMQDQLQVQVGWRDSSATLFAGCCLLFVEAPTGTTATDTTTTGSTGNSRAAGTSSNSAAMDSSVILLGCAVEAQKLADAWCSLVSKQQLADVKLAVMLHGGAVAEAYGPQVTHLVLWPGPGSIGSGKQQQQQQPQSSGASLPGWLHPWSIQGTQGFEQYEADEGIAFLQRMSAAQRHMQLPVQLLLQLLAQTATAAVDAATATAAAAAVPAAKASTSLRTQGNKSRKLAIKAHAAAAAAGILPPSAAAAQGAALGRSASASTAAGQARPQGVQGRMGALAAKLAAGESHVMEHVLAEQTHTKGPDLSSAALKQLKLIRCRLIAAQRINAPGMQQQQHREGGNGSSAVSKGRNLITLYIVQHSWVTDSLAELQQQQQDEVQDRWGTAHRHSELLHMPEVLLGEMQPVIKPEPGAEADTAATAAGGAAGSAIDVRKWPWQLVGLNVGSGGGGSSDSATDGGSSSQSSGKKTREKRRASPSQAADAPSHSKRKHKDRTATEAALKQPNRQAAEGTGDGADEGIPVSQSRDRRTATRATEVKGRHAAGKRAQNSNSSQRTSAAAVADTYNKAVANGEADGEGSEGQQTDGGAGSNKRRRGAAAQGRRDSRGRSSRSCGHGRGKNRRVIQEDSEDTAKDSETARKSGLEVQGRDGGSGERNRVAGGNSSEGPVAGDVSEGGQRVSAATAGGGSQEMQQTQKRRLPPKGKTQEAVAGQDDSAIPPGWLGDKQRQHHHQQQQQSPAGTAAAGTVTTGKPDYITATQSTAARSRLNSRTGAAPSQQGNRGTQAPVSLAARIFGADAPALLSQLPNQLPLPAATCSGAAAAANTQRPSTTSDAIGETSTAAGGCASLQVAVQASMPANPCATLPPANARIVAGRNRILSALLGDMAAPGQPAAVPAATGGSVAYQQAAGATTSSSSLQTNPVWEPTAGAVAGPAELSAAQLGARSAAGAVNAQSQQPQQQQVTDATPVQRSTTAAIVPTDGTGAGASAQGAGVKKVSLAKMIAELKQKQKHKG